MKTIIIDEEFWDDIDEKNINELYESLEDLEESEEDV